MGTIDEAKGRLKEAIGVLSGNKNLKRQGKVDQVVGKAKDTVDNIRAKADEKVEQLRDKPESD